MNNIGKPKKPIRTAYFNLAYQNICERGHICNANGNCVFGGNVSAGEHEVRIRYPESNNSLGMHPECWQQMLKSDLKEWSNVYGD